MFSRKSQDIRGLMRGNVRQSCLLAIYLLRISDACTLPAKITAWSPQAGGFLWGFGSWFMFIFPRLPLYISRGVRYFCFFHFVPWTFSISCGSFYRVLIFCKYQPWDLAAFYGRSGSFWILAVDFHCFLRQIWEFLNLCHRLPLSSAVDLAIWDFLQ